MNSAQTACLHVDFSQTLIIGYDLIVANFVAYRLSGTHSAEEQTTSLPVFSSAFRNANESSVHASHITILRRNMMCCDTKY